MQRWRSKVAELCEIDLRSLAVFRIALGLIIIADLVMRVPDLHGHYSDEGVWPRELAGHQKWPVHLWYLSPIYSLNGPVWFAAALFLVAAIVAVALILGYHARTAAAVSWVLLVSLHARLSVVLNGGDNLLSQLLFWSMFLPLGARWSLDAREKNMASLRQASS